MNYRMLSAALLLLATIGCGKKGDAPAPAAEKSASAPAASGSAASTSSSAPAGSLSAMLCGKEWKMVAVTSEPPIDINGDGKANSELIASGEIRQCLLDNLEIYGADGSYTSASGPEKCDPSEAEREAGTWKFNADSTAVMLALRGEAPEQVNIVELSDARLKQSMEIKQGGTTYTMTATYTHK